MIVIMGPQRRPVILGGPHFEIFRRLILRALGCSKFLAVEQ